MTRRARDKINALREREAARRDAALQYLRDATAARERAERELHEKRETEDRCAAQAYYCGATWVEIGEIMGRAPETALRRGHAATEPEGEDDGTARNGA